MWGRRRPLALRLSVLQGLEPERDVSHVAAAFGDIHHPTFTSYAVMAQQKPRWFSTQSHAELSSGSETSIGSRAWLPSIVNR